MLGIVYVRQHLTEEYLVCYAIRTISFERKNLYFSVYQANHKGKAPN